MMSNCKIYSTEIGLKYISDLFVFLNYVYFLQMNYRTAYADNILYIFIVDKTTLCRICSKVRKTTIRKTLANSEAKLLYTSPYGRKCTKNTRKQFYDMDSSPCGVLVCYICSFPLNSNI